MSRNLGVSTKSLRGGTMCATAALVGALLVGCAQYSNQSVGPRWLFGGEESASSSRASAIPESALAPRATAIPESGAAAANLVERDWPYEEAAAIQSVGVRPHARVQRLSFRPGSASLDLEAQGALRESLHDFESNTRWKIVIVGATDRNEARANPMHLCEQRTDVVKRWLVGQGVDGSRISTMSVGSGYAEGDEFSPTTMESDRRVDVWAFM